MKKYLTLACILLVWFVGANLLTGAASPLQSGIDEANFDPSIPVGQDFFEHLNGQWIKANPIPPDQSRWGSFNALHEKNLKELQGILVSLSSIAGPDEDQRKLRDFYATAMDEAKLQNQGAAPLKDWMDKIAALKTAADLTPLLAEFHSSGIWPLFDFGVGQDAKNSTQYIVEVGQGGLSLPEKNYYLGTDDYTKKIRAQFKEHVARMFKLLGDPQAAAGDEAGVVLEIETKLAEVSRSPVQLRDVEALYNKKTISQLEELSPAIHWGDYFKMVGAGEVNDLVVEEPEFLTRINQMLPTVPMDQWKTYLRWHLLQSTSSYLSDDFADESFEFYGKTLRGQKQIEARWKRAVQTIDRMMGEDLGRLYVRQYFPPEYKQRMGELVGNIIAAYKERIKGADWMGAATKQHALDKLVKVMPKIAYPDRWRDYSALQIGQDSYVANVLAGRKFNFEYHVHKLGKPIDRNDWGMTPPTVNAYYNPRMNEIVFPAGILQPPFFNGKADDAVNYGAIGAVIGHELTHGFDDQGSLFDAEGNMKNWWTPDDKKRFHQKAEALVKQYDACVVEDDLHVNGKLTLGENIADLGGLTIAYNAYQRSLNGKSAPIIDGFTGNQRLFMGFAQVWRGSSRPEALRVSVRTDPHSPVQFRCDVPVSNIQAFYDAFGLKPGDKMFRPPQDRVQIW
jgi:putative endopeptidase